MSSFVLVSILFVVLSGLVWAQKRWRLLRPAFFARFPLTAFALLVVTPLAMFNDGVAHRFGNLFSLTPVQAAVVSMLATFAAWSIVLAVTVVQGQVAKGRYELRRDRFVMALGSEDDGPDQQFVPPPVRAERVKRRLERYRWALSILLAAPVLVAVLRLSPGRPWVALGIVVGLGIAIGFRTFFAWLWDQWLPEFLQSVTFIFVTLFFYVVGYLVLRPNVEFSAVFEAVSALAYLLLVIILVMWFLLAASVILDRYRIPVVVVLAVIGVMLYAIFDSDHYFEVQSRPGAPLSPDEALTAWHGRADGELPVVIVAASGGGIAASYWAARVLTGLQQEISDFPQSIVLVSSNSGGAIGAMYFVDGYLNGRPPAPDLVLDASRVSALATTTWGVAYPDLLRLVTGGFLPSDRRLDRGWSLEQTWLRGGGVRGVTIGDWREDVRDARRPAIVFNTTVGESGTKLLISSVDVASVQAAGCPIDPVGFRALYPDKDVAVVTAARLSMTLPWVLPMARAREGAEVGDLEPCHLADGGYADNSGVWSAVEFLREIGPERFLALGRERVLLVEIGGAGPRDPGEHEGWLWSTLGPVITLINADLGSQTSRDNLEGCLLRGLWAASGVNVGHVRFSLDEGGPTFWDLPDTHRSEIDGNWNHVTAERRYVEEFFAGNIPPLDGCDA